MPTIRTHDRTTTRPAPTSKGFGATQHTQTEIHSDVRAHNYTHTSLESQTTTRLSQQTLMSAALRALNNALNIALNSIQRSTLTRHSAAH